MAGGEGSRLRPLTCSQPKPMVPIINRPCMEHIVNLLAQHQIYDIAVTLQYLPEKVQEYFGDGSRFGVKLHYFVEEKPLGTAGSVKNAEDFLDETFIVISGDAVTDCDLDQAVRFHKEKGALATLVLTVVPCPLEYGVVVTEKDGRITRFLEKPGWSEVFSDQVNTGIYILEPEVLDFIKRGKMVDFSKDLYPLLLAARKPLYGYVTQRYWCDIGNVGEYLRAHCDLLERKAGVAFPGREVSFGVWIGEGGEVSPEAELIPPVVLGDGCVVSSGARVGPFTVLGKRVRIASGASVKRSVVWDDVWIGEGAVLRGAVVGKAASIQAGASLFEGAVVGDRSVVGEKSVVKSGVKIWPEKWIEKGAKVQASLVWGHCVRASLFGSRGVRGDLNVEVGPEVACRLGMAAGSAVDLPARFALSTDGSPGALMLKQGLLSGLMATGVKVIELGNLPVPVHRYAVRALELQGGVYVCCQEKVKACIRFFNPLGIDYHRGEQRKVEAIFLREEYRRVGSDEVSGPEYLPDLSYAYLKHLLGFLEQDTIKKARLKVVVDYNPTCLGTLLPAFFESLGSEMVTFALPHQFPRSFGEMLKSAEFFGEVVRNQGASFGAVLDAGAEELVLVDEEGRIVPQELLISLLSFIILSENPKAIVALPVTASGSVEEIARVWGGKIRRTKVAPWELMQVLHDEEVRDSQKRYPQFLIFGDAVATLGVIMDYIARKRKAISQIIREIPVFATAQKEVEVSWEEKGRVIRRLAESTQGREVELIDGVKIYHPKGWTLVLPDADEPVCRIYSEGFDQEIAESLTEFYGRKIKELCRESQEKGRK